MANPDLILLHPPSVFDFRERDDLIFPYFLSNIVSVSPMLEIFPLGFYNIKSYLEARHIKVEIYNLASMMLKDWEFNVRYFLTNLKPKIFGVDLYWLIHAHGSLKVCELIKDMHKEIPILLGGVSASYFYEELIRYPFIDFVIRGNITFSPLDLLMKQIIKGKKDYSKIPNLCFKKNSKIIINPIKFYTEKEFYPINWDIHELKSKDLNFFITNPTLGCRHNCCFCGACRYATKSYSLQRNSLLYRPQSQMLKELDTLKKLRNNSLKSKKIDLFIPGYWHEDDKIREVIFKKIKKINYFSSIYLELFNLMPKHIIEEITKYVSPVFEISPESHDINIRRACGRAVYTNKKFELWLEKALNLNVKRIIVYFMIGLPGQTIGSVMGTVKYCEHLLRKFKNKKRVVPFLSTMIPFLNPASPAFENPEKYGYKLFYKTVEEHVGALTSISFKNRLNYETKWMSRKQIIQVTCDSAKMLTQAKVKYGYLTSELGKGAISRVDNTSKLIDVLDKIDSIGDSNRRLEALNSAANKVKQYNQQVMQTKFGEQVFTNLRLYNFWYEI